MKLLAGVGSSCCDKLNKLIVIIQLVLDIGFVFCNKFIVQFCFRLVEEEEISCEVKAEFKEKTKVWQLQLNFHIMLTNSLLTLTCPIWHFLQENSKLQKTIKGQEEEIQRLKEAIEFRDNFLAVSLSCNINLECLQLEIL